MRATALVDAGVDAGLGAEGAAQVPVALGVIPFVREHGPDARHDGEGGQEQPLEEERVVDVGRCRGAPEPRSRRGLLERGAVPALATT